MDGFIRVVKPVASPSVDLLDGWLVDVRYEAPLSALSMPYRDACFMIKILPY